MTRPSPSSTARRRCSSGFTLLECLTALFILSLLMPVALSMTRQPDVTYYLFDDRYFCVQSDALASAETQELDYAGQPLITFNQRGNVSLARTLTFHTGLREHAVIIELGGGRLVER